MRKLFFKKPVHLERVFESFWQSIETCTEAFIQGLTLYLDHGADPEFERAAERVIQLESDADSVRKDIERMLFRDELLPESRGDLFNLLEWCDKVANRIESVIKNLDLRRVDIPSELRGDIRDMLVPTQTCVSKLLEAGRVLFSEPAAVRAAIDDVSRLESTCDSCQDSTIRKIYTMDLDLAHKMLLEHTISEIGSIADRAEDATHFLEIIAIKRTL